ncbi:MAG: MOSC domain-containing protein [Rhodothermales bacterium]
MPAVWTGTLETIYLAPDAGAPVRSVAAVRAEPGRGLEGDRYWKGEGSFSRWPGARREVTLIAAEALADAEAEFGVAVSAGEHRRNLVVTGVPLGDLVKAEFWVGSVRMRGERVCAPCKYLVRVTGQEALFDALVRRGGLRASLLSEGMIRAGDTLRPA